MPYNSNTAISNNKIFPEINSGPTQQGAWIICELKEAEKGPGIGDTGIPVLPVVWL